MFTWEGCCGFLAFFQILKPVSVQFKGDITGITYMLFGKGKGFVLSLEGSKCSLWRWLIISHSFSVWRVFQDQLEDLINVSLGEQKTSNIYSIFPLRLCFCSGFYCHLSRYDTRIKCGEPPRVFENGMVYKFYSLKKKKDEWICSMWVGFIEECAHLFRRETKE